MSHQINTNNYILIYNSDGSGIQIQKITKKKYEEGNEYIEIELNQEIIDLIFKAGYNVAKQDILASLETFIDQIN